MSRIKVLHHCKGVGLSGTDRTMMLMCKYLDRSKFDPYILYRENADCSCLDEAEKAIGKDHVVKYEHMHGENKPPYLPKLSNFWDKVKEISPDILHAHIGGHDEFPFLPCYRIALPKIKFVCTHIFENLNRFPWDLRLFICDYLVERIFGRTSKTTANLRVLNNPVELPHAQKKKEEKDRVIIGRIGRPDNFCDISLKAIKWLVNKGVRNFEYRIVNPCKRWGEVAAELGIVEYCKFLEPIYSSKKLSEFYSDVDIVAHARADGEVNSVALSEAMIHGVPVVTHFSPVYNGQEELIKKTNGGYIVNWKDHEAYARHLKYLIDHPDARHFHGMLGQKWCEENVEASVVARKLERHYLSIL